MLFIVFGLLLGVGVVRGRLVNALPSPRTDTPRKACPDEGRGESARIKEPLPNTALFSMLPTPPADPSFVGVAAVIWRCTMAGDSLPHPHTRHCPPIPFHHTPFL
jgi:hypothetical protein